MNKTIIGLILGMIISTPLFALGKLVANSVETVFVQHSYSGDNEVLTTKITTEEGTYRIFIFSGFRKGGITAVKIK